MHGEKGCNRWCVKHGENLRQLWYKFQKRDTMCLGITHWNRIYSPWSPGKHLRRNYCWCWFRQLWGRGKGTKFMKDAESLKMFQNMLFCLYFFTDGSLVKIGDGVRKGYTYIQLPLRWSPKNLLCSSYDILYRVSQIWNSLKAFQELYDLGKKIFNDPQSLFSK